MGLVDYSESDSGSDIEGPPRPTPKPLPSQSTSKKPFQKVVDRSNPGKIVVSLPPPTYASNPGEPPAKRARTTAGGGLFSGLNSFLPPPKNVGKPVATSHSSAPPRLGVNLKTSAAPGFSRHVDEYTERTAEDGTSAPSLDMNLPPSKKQDAAPSIPEGQKPAEDVKLVGKPLKFRPLSVGFNAKKKEKKNKPSSALNSTPQTSAEASGTAAAATPAEPPAKKKISLFSMHTEQPPDPTPSSSNGTYEPLFESAYEPDANSAPYIDTDTAYYETPATTATGNAESLDVIADNLHLSAVARRELFGRDGAQLAAKKVVNFNMDKEYQHNESVRAAGDQQAHRAVRSIQGGGKHSLKQLVQNVQNQRDALEDSFASARSNKKATSSKYGW
ncbi:Mitotic checkpoint protein PRCC [Metarhizium rileyi]|uniref:Mitotic checkpoint protein PRCC n=1 Tax=Metarhizium rileyi (strain RCEF 4871) TaxID=1649241 RepID=A0A167F5H3_METRR|nr:Mitotic checkpoint protein PRCC [Metarhizium rileyi RCEF 4871]TWU74830.1 hypothetical protein ED733_006664 [Metarhizium rileyi]